MTVYNINRIPIVREKKWPELIIDIIINNVWEIQTEF